MARARKTETGWPRKQTPLPARKVPRLKETERRECLVFLVAFVVSVEQLAINYI